MNYKHPRAALRSYRRFLSLTFCLAIIALLSDSSISPLQKSPVSPNAEANSVYFNLASAAHTFSITPASVDQITSNDNWSGVGSVEGYFGQNLTATHGVDPQTVLGTEFPSNQLPSSPTNVAANKGNPSAFNAGGVAEFDSGAFLAIGLQGNVQSNPYLVFYVNSTGRSNITISYTVQDIDGGSNNSVSSLALQYRIGQTGLFTNLPDGYIADVTTGGIATPSQTKTVELPPAANNQPQLQIRLITTNAANSSGGSTADEWIGINNVSVTSLAPSAAGVEVGGRVVTGDGQGIRGAYVTISDSTGNSRTAITNPFGYFRFSDVESGQTYVFEIRSKRHTFENSSVVRTITDSVVDLEFVADGADKTSSF